MKKLLILGGNYLSCDIVTTAKSMGVYTIVTDWNDPAASPAKQIADEAWDVSLTDYDEIDRRIREQHIDGVFTNYTDSYLIPYVRICGRAGLPCLASEEQIEWISNKDKSKMLCQRHGISVPKIYPVSRMEDLDSLDIKYPVLTKPVDQSGQRGIFVCNDKEELKHYFPVSLEYSASRKVMVEEYLQGDYVVMFYTIQDGVVSLASMADKPVTEVIDPNQVKLPKLYILPSRYVDLCIETVLPKVQSFVAELGLKNGVIGIEAIVSDGVINVFEMQFRLGGMRHHEFVLQENRMNIMQMLVGFALTGKFEGWNARECDNAHFKNTYGLLNVLVQTGKIGKIEGLDKVRELPYVTKLTQMCKEGDEIELPATVQQILCKLSIKTTTREKLFDHIREIYSLIKVSSPDCEDMVMKVW